jgi:hypothetical protein
MKAVALAVLLTACLTEKNPNFCASDADCAGTPRPFCDVNGEFTPSNGTKNVCTETPSDCPIERCGCTPGESLACDVDQQTVCAADGMSTATSTCALGCSTEDRCLTFEPSNGLGPALEMAAAEPDVILPNNARIDTDTGLVQDANGMPIEVRSVVVPQTGAPSIRAFLARSFLMDAVTARGANALALVASGKITIRGQLDASADLEQQGPGASESVGACVGVDAFEEACGNPPIVFRCWVGGGGGGNSTQGARGGGTEAQGGGQLGGASLQAFVPFKGGCAGGALRETGGAIHSGGGGGGAAQLVSLETITFANAGIMNVGGGGGRSSGGGGAGGIAIIEAPFVAFEGAATGIAANGGAGGGCELAGGDAGITTAPAPAPRCAQRSGGNGGTSGAVPEAGELSCPTGGSCVFAAQHGGGGGAIGRARVSTRTGEISVSGTPVLSVSLTKTMLILR